MKLSSKQIAELVINYCKENDILDELPKVINYLELENKKISGKSELVIITRQKLEVSAMEKIRNFITKKDVVIRERIDPSIEGGFIAKYEGKVYDGSIKTQLAKLKNYLESK